MKDCDSAILVETKENIMCRSNRLKLNQTLARVKKKKNKKKINKNKEKKNNK